MAFPLLSVLDIGTKIIDRLIPDPQAKAAATLELFKAQQAGEFKLIEADLQSQLAQAEINKIEASSTNWFVSGWRPACGWVCVAGLAYAFILRQLLTFIFNRPAPEVEMSTLMTLLFGLLGLGGMRMYEKLQGVERK